MIEEQRGVGSLCAVRSSEVHDRHRHKHPAATVHQTLPFKVLFVTMRTSCRKLLYVLFTYNCQRLGFILNLRFERDVFKRACKLSVCSSKRNHSAEECCRTLF